MATRTEPVALERVLPPLPPPDRRITVTELHELLPQETRGVGLLDGVLLVTPSPHGRHTHVAFELAVGLRSWCEEHGGRGFTEPQTVGRGGTLRATALPGCELSVDDILTTR